MLQDRLTSLAVLHVHRDIDIDVDRVMRSFTLGKSRHIGLTEMLQSTTEKIFKQK
jgi:hypothetical protein